LHIGASTENAQIGGVDKPVIRRKKDDQPYLPGSSLKGKMRCLLEQRRGATEVGKSNDVNKLFGFSAQEMQSKILFRDADLTIESAKQLKDNYNTDLPYSEVKFENSISRTSGTATNPRQIERVPAGAKFLAKFVINVWDTDNENDFISLFKEGIQLLESDYIGGSGTRGYGHIKIELGEPKDLLK
nr:type III-A CRISPR-associated RAMP protein Csm3 [Saprospiraceae bacterium]